MDTAGWECPMTASTPAQYLDMRAAIEFSTMSRRTLDYAKDRGDLPFIRKGRKIVFRRSDLERWMERDLIDVTDDTMRISAYGGR